MKYKIPKKGSETIERVILKVKYGLICMKNIFKEIKTFQFLKNLVEILRTCIINPGTPAQFYLSTQPNLPEYIDQTQPNLRSLRNQFIKLQIFI